MVGGNISSEKIDLLVYGPHKQIVTNGFPDRFILHPFETTADLERLTPEEYERRRAEYVRAGKGKPPPGATPLPEDGA